MALVIWKDAYSVDIEEIDNQHKKLIELINELHEAMMKGKAKEVLRDVLNRLVDYTVYHFSTEEKYFDKYDYPEKELHKIQHKSLVEQVAEIQQKFNSGERVLTIDVMNFLRDWLNDHILGSDTKYGPFLKNKETE